LFGFSSFSSEVAILCATIPDKINQPTTTNDGPNVIFNWDQPLSNGLPITLYKVYIRKYDLVYAINADACDGSSSAVILNTECSVPLSKLASSPILLLESYSVNIKVIATNAYGDSEISDPGAGAVIQLIPDYPINLQNDPSVTNRNTIGITWSDGTSDGGSPILDWRITYD
jgi:hypothetical protein